MAQSAFGGKGKFLFQDMGFELLREEKNVRTNYDQNPRNMLKYTYDSVFFVYQKL